MQRSALSSIIVLLAIVSSVAVVPGAYAADHATIVSTPAGTSSPGCEETNECYIPYEVTISPGGEVTWSNDDSAAHTVTSGTPADGPDGHFDSSLFMAGTTYSVTLDDAGEYPYFCMVHPWMQGVVIVDAAAAEEHMEETEEVMEEAMEETEEVMEEAMEETEEVMEEAMEETEEVMEEAMEETEEVMEETEAAAEGGGCLIATAAYGSELAPQVQFLREVRDNTLLSTESGSTFMAGFNSFYYSFSPAIADLERDNPMFKETVKAVITPMLSTLSIMTLADPGSESQVLGLGMLVISLNLGMYIAAPAAAGFVIGKKLKSRN